MDEETQQIFREQLTKLPGTVVTFLASSNWNDELDAISSLFNLDADQSSNYRREATLILSGLVHPDDFTAALQNEVGLQAGVLESVVKMTEEKVFAPVRAALVEFSEKEEEPEQPPIAQAVVKPVVTPENLPFAPEPEHLIPPIPSKPTPVPPNESSSSVFSDRIVPAIQPVASHPFEEKMKQVFTAGATDTGEFVLEPAPVAIPAEIQPVSPTPITEAAPAAPLEPTAPQTPPPTPIPPPRRVDPYREPIEE